jgi:gluconate kinase
MTRADLLEGWVPIRVDWRSSPPEVDWCHLGAERFIDPFFDQTIGRRLQEPFCLLFRHRTPIDALIDRAAHHPGLRPAGFIFHMSRCGSTLIAQMLAAQEKSVVISEADPIDSVLRAPGFCDDQRVEWLRGMIAALGQPRRGDETHLVVKFDSWNTLDLPLIRLAFPGVPWVFVYRNPVEVLVSQIKQRAAYMIPGRLGVGPADPASVLEALTKPEEHCAQILASFCRAAVEQHRRDPGLLLNYSELPGAVETKLLDAFGIAAPAEDVARMRAATQFDAKNAYVPFEDDTVSKERAATELIRQIADRWIGPVYAELEAIRRSFGAPAL